MTISLLTLIAQETKAAIYQRALDLAEFVGVPVTSWSAGDPTRSLYHLLSETLETFETIVVNYIKSGFLDYAEGDWLKLLAKQKYNYDAQEATYGTCTVVLTNTGGGLYVISAGDLTLKNTETDKTYRNTSGGTLSPGPGTTLSLTVVADEAGAASNAAVGEIDDLVTTLLGVTCTNTTAAVGLDAETDESIRSGCRAKLGALSPNGPADAYSSVARNSTLTGTTGITRVSVVGDTVTGAVSIYLAGPSGAVSGPDVTAATTAITTYATPTCSTPLVDSAVNKLVPVSYSAWVYARSGKTVGQVQTAVEAALAAMLLERPIGGDVIAPASGKLYKALIESAITGAVPGDVANVSVTTPAGDTALEVWEVAVLSTVTHNVTIIPDPV